METQETGGYYDWNVQIEGFENIVMPREGDLGIDLIAKTRKINFEENQVVYGTGVKLSPDDPFLHCLVFPRSSISKTALRLANSVAVIDSSYRGEIRLVFDYRGMNMRYYEDGTNNLRGIYKVGDKIAQMVFTRQLNIHFHPVEKIEQDTQRGDDGFGSTGK